MNRLLTFAGQQPIYLGDFDFMQDASKGMFACIARALMNQESDTLNAILQGVNIQYAYSDQKYEWDAGVVVLNGEVLPVLAGSLSGRVGTSLYFHVSEETSGERVLKDGTTRNCWATRYAYINGNRTGGVSVASVERLHKNENQEEDSDDVVYTGTTSSPLFSSGKLIRKNGFWFCDIVMAITEDTYSTFGSISFSGLSAEHVAELRLKSFTFLIPLMTSRQDSSSEWSAYFWEAQAVRVTFSDEVSTGVLEMSLTPLNTVVRLAGAATLQQLLLVY